MLFTYLGAVPFVMRHPWLNNIPVFFLTSLVLSYVIGWICSRLARSIGLRRRAEAYFRGEASIASSPTGKYTGISLARIGIAARIFSSAQPSLLCLLEVPQIRRGLVLPGRHQQPIAA
jgi:hypothetical protein